MPFTMESQTGPLRLRRLLGTLRVPTRGVTESVRLSKPGRTAHSLTHSHSRSYYIPSLGIPTCETSKRSLGGDQAPLPPQWGWACLGLGASGLTGVRCWDQVLICQVSSSLAGTAAQGHPEVTGAGDCQKLGRVCLLHYDPSFRHHPAIAPKPVATKGQRGWVSRSGSQMLWNLDWIARWKNQVTPGDLGG